jgi:hypothetical protein
MVAMKKRMLLGAGSVAALSSLVAACGGYNNNLGPAYCGNPAHIALIYPAPGATAVPNTISVIYVAAPQSLGTSTTYGLALLGPAGYVQNTNTFTAVSASAVPSPAASPGFGNPHYYQSSLVAPLSPTTEYSVDFNDTANFCTPNVSLGDFTTR